MAEESSAKRAALSDEERRRRRVDAMRAWRKANPERSREIGREARRRRREREATGARA
jgi:hypothetical protein